jgi:hypothetical protein
MFSPALDDLRPGDTICREEGQTVRLHTSNPFGVKRVLHRIGFRLLYFNSEVQLGAGRHRPSLRAHFDRYDHFYACEKR